MTGLLVNGVHLNAEVSGMGPPLVLLHGFTGSVATWSPLVKAASGSYTTIALDVLGHGASDSPESPDRYRMERCVADLLVALDQLNVSHASLLGYSMGGRLALSAAVEAPDRWDALVLESASPGLADPEERAARTKSDGELADFIEEQGVEAFVDRWERLPLWASQSRLPQPMRDALRRQRLQNNPQGLANSLRGMGAGAQAPVHARLAGLDMPVLFIAGEEDERYVALAWSMCGRVANSRVAVVAQAGHAVHLEQPSRFHAAVLEFLSACGDRRDSRRANLDAHPLSP